MKTRDFEKQAEAVKALAHPARLLMVHALRDGEQCVCKLQELVGSDMSTVSKHLSVLKNAGLIAGEKRGQWVYYSLRCPCILQFLDCVNNILNEVNG